MLAKAIKLAEDWRDVSRGWEELYENLIITNIMLRGRIKELEQLLSGRVVETEGMAEMPDKVPDTTPPCPTITLEDKQPLPKMVGDMPDSILESAIEDWRENRSDK